MSVLNDSPRPADQTTGESPPAPLRAARRADPPWQRRYHRQGWLYIAPALLFFALMVAYPIGRSLYLSFYDYSILEPDSAKFVGAGNYEKLFTQPQNQRPFRNTLYFTVLFTPPYVILALVIAMMLNACRRGTVVLRTLIFAPVVVSLAVSAVMWLLFYNPSFGLAQKMLVGAVTAVNHPWHFAASALAAAVVMLAGLSTVGAAARLFRRDGSPKPAKPRRLFLVGSSAALGALIAAIWWVMAQDSALDTTQDMLAAIGLSPRGLDLAGAPANGMLGDSRWSMIAIVILCIWNGVGINIILFLVGLQRIPDELYEAGMVDGAGSWRRFTHITLPQLRPTIYLVVLLSLIGAFKVFGQPYIMTAGGPEESTLTFVMRLYNLAFKYGKFELGYASALAYSLAVFILFVTLLIRRVNKPTD